MNEKKQAIFESLPVKKAVLLQAMPAVASQMVTLIYNLADTYFVGLLNDPNQTAAITVAFPSFLMLTAISNLFGIGGASAIARALGKKDEQGARRISTISMWFGLLAACSFSLAFTLLMDPILHLCGATQDTYALASGYARWVVALGGPFTVMNTLFANLVRSEGGANHASIGVSLGGVMNIFLDPLFILPQFLGLGAVGAGIATALSNVAATVYFVGYLAVKRSTTILSPSPANLRYTHLYLKTILSIGLPSALQYALTVVAVSAQSKFVSKYPTEAVAALGIIKKIDMLPLYFSTGVSNGLLPLLAYNHSSGNRERRKAVFRFGCTLTVGFSLTCVVVYEIFAVQLASLLIKDPVTITYSAAFLRRMVTCMPLMSMCYPMLIQFQAMGQVKASLVCSILRKGILDIPLLFLMDALIPLYGCMWVQPIVDAISLVVAAAFYRSIMRKEEQASPA